MEIIVKAEDVWVREVGLNLDSPIALVLELVLHELLLIGNRYLE